MFGILLRYILHINLSRLRTVATKLFTIYFDSLAYLKAFKSRFTGFGMFLKTLEKQVCLCWNPSHSDIAGNEGTGGLPFGISI